MRFRIVDDGCGYYNVQKKKWLLGYWQYYMRTQPADSPWFYPSEWSTRKGAEVFIKLEKDRLNGKDNI